MVGRSVVTLASLLAALLAQGACARPPFDATAEQQNLLRLDAEWAAAAQAGKDVDKIMSYFGDEALMFEPGEPVYEGKAAIRGFVERSLKTPGFSIHWVSEQPVFSPDGNMAYMRGADEMTVPGPNGAVLTVHMRGVSVWRRGANGAWRCVVDIANEPPAGR